MEAQQASDAKVQKSMELLQCFIELGLEIGKNLPPVLETAPLMVARYDGDEVICTTPEGQEQSIGTPDLACHRVSRNL